MVIKQDKIIEGKKREVGISNFTDFNIAKPEKKLLLIKKRTGGRNATGRITVRHRGGGAKRFIRVIDYKRDKFDIVGVIKTIEYDPNRGARIALVVYQDGEKRYIIAPNELNIGDEIISSHKQVKVMPGNSMPLEYIPVGSMIYNIELTPGKGGQLVRGAGESAQLLAIEGKYATIKLPSGEVRKILKKCLATLGTVSNPEYITIKWEKAGRIRHLGIRPSVRGKVMNPVDHPHGGGEGKQPIGLKYPKTPWGKHALGVKTRKPKKYSDKFIIQSRKKKKKG